MITDEKLRAMEFELELLGKTRQEQELLQYNHQLDLEAARLKIGMSQENIAKLDEEIAKLKERRANEKLVKSESDLKAIVEQVPISEFHDKLKSLLPTLDMSKVNIDNIGFSLDDLNRIFSKC